MAKRPVTTADVLDGHVSLDLECLDRIYLNGYVPKLQVGGQVVQFLALRGFPIPSPAVINRIGDGFRRAVRSFADSNQISVIKFGKGERKIEKMKPFLARQEATGRSGVAGIGWAQEFQRVATCTITEARTGGAPHFGWDRAERRVTCYYFYVWGRGLRVGVRQDRQLLSVSDQGLGERPRVGQASGRFVFYELEGRGLVRKSSRGESRRGTADDPREQEVIDALTHLRDHGVIPWTWLVDETRQLYQWQHAPTVAEYVRRSVDRARINPWPGEPPLLLVESRSLGGVLRATSGEYLVAIAATNGQTGGFLHTEVAPILADNDRVVLYLGDWDLQGPPDRGEHAERSGTCGRPAVRPSQLESGRDHRRPGPRVWPRTGLEGRQQASAGAGP
jgi:hypothetical protein